MPVLEHAAGGEPEWIGVVGGFGGRLIRERENARLAIRMAIELDPGAGSHIRVEAFAEPPSRLGSVDHRPTQPALAMIAVERREIVAMAATEAGIFLEQALVHIEAERLGFIVLVACFNVG